MQGLVFPARRNPAVLEILAAIIAVGFPTAMGAGVIRSPAVMKRPYLDASEILMNSLYHHRPIERLARFVISFVMEQL